MSRKPPWLRRRIRDRNADRSLKLPQGMLLMSGRNVVPAKNDDAVSGHKVTRTGWMVTHPRFHDPLHPTRKAKGFQPWYGDHNEHKPPKPK